MRIALDFDGTIIENCSYPGIGEDLGAIPALLRIQELGARIFLWTCRGGQELEDAQKYLLKRGIALNVPRFLPGSAKPVADLYIDDRGLGAPLTPKGLDWRVVGPRLIEAVAEIHRARAGAVVSRPHGDGES